MKAFVTGGAGFIGSHLVERLLADGKEVIAIDDLSTGDSNALKKHMEKKGFAFHQLDVRNYERVSSLLEGCDVVFHLAAQTSVEESVKDPLQTNSINVDGTLTMLQASVKRGVKRFVFSSSAAVYGKPSELPLKETSPTRPISPYGASKLASEYYVKVFNHIHRLETVVLRLFNVYGPGQRMSPYAGVVLRFAEAIKKGEPLTIFGDGNQIRDFIHIDDCVNALILAMEERNANGQTINIGTGRRTTIIELAQMLIWLSGKKELKPTFTAEKPGDIRESYADITKAKEILAFEPRISLEEGLSGLLKSL